VSQDRNLDNLDPRYSGLFHVYLGELARTFPQFEVLVTDVRRTKEQQLAKVEEGEGVTRTRYSNHLLDRAIDVAFLRRATGKIDWRPETYINVYERLDPRLFGLVSGGHLWRGWDWAHLQLLDSRLVYPALIGSKEDVWIDR